MKDIKVKFAKKAHKVSAVVGEVIITLAPVSIDDLETNEMVKMMNDLLNADNYLLTQKVTKRTEYYVMNKSLEVIAEAKRLKPSDTNWSLKLS